MIEQGTEVRIVPIVEDDEPRIDGELRVIGLDINRVCVTAHVIRALVDRHMMTAAQQPRRRETGDATANDGDALFGSVGDY